MKSGLENIKKSILIKELNGNGTFFDNKGTNLRDLSYADLKLLLYKVRVKKESENKVYN